MRKLLAMGNIWSTRWDSWYERKTYVDQYRRSPGRLCPRCGRAVRFLYAPYQFISRFAGTVIEPQSEDWACRVCHGLVYRSQYKGVWENDYKRTVSDRIERSQKFLDEIHERQSRQIARELKRRPKRAQS